MSLNSSKHEDLKAYSLTADPLESFLSWHESALKIEENANAMALATAAKSGVPSVRMVLFKGCLGEKFSLYGHNDSQKGLELEENPYASLVFYWHRSLRQVRITGAVEKMTKQQTLNYFSSRALESQVASSVSKQSQPIANRETLESNFQNALKLAKETGSIAMPENWQGYYLVPQEIEFFIYRDFRLNDRFLFKKNSEARWDWQRLQP